MPGLTSFRLEAHGWLEENNRDERQFQRIPTPLQPASLGIATEYRALTIRRSAELGLQ